MATAYLYRNLSVHEAPSVLSNKIDSEIGVTPTEVQLLDNYGYITFATALSTEEQAALDDFMAAREGTFEATDATPSSGIGGIAQSPDTSYWKLTVDDLGVMLPVKVA